VGEHEVIYPAKDAVRRLGEAAPAIRARIVPDAGHDITIVQAALVNETVVDFLQSLTSHSAA
jgi:pimeloyl-ACP methyl ester carboxylesterase